MSTIPTAPPPTRSRGSVGSSAEHLASRQDTTAPAESSTRRHFPHGCSHTHTFSLSLSLFLSLSLSLYPSLLTAQCYDTRSSKLVWRQGTGHPSAEGEFQQRASPAEIRRILLLTLRLLILFESNLIYGRFSYGHENSTPYNEYYVGVKPSEIHNVSAGIGRITSCKKRVHPDRALFTISRLALKAWDHWAGSLLLRLKERGAHAGCSVCTGCSGGSKNSVHADAKRTSRGAQTLYVTSVVRAVRFSTIS